MSLIYIVEDDADIREIETIAMQNSGYEVCAFEKASEFFEQVETKFPDLVILDIMLPDCTGNEVVRRLRRRPATQKLPVIMVTAKTAEIDIIRGLDDGADDYIKKPFSVMELISRVKALLRRVVDQNSRVLLVGDLSLDQERRVVTYAGDSVELTYKEFELLRLLMSHPGMVMSRDTIIHRVWEWDYEGESRTVDMHIKTLRQKLGVSGKYIKTVRNVGYVIESI